MRTSKVSEATTSQQSGDVRQTEQRSLPRGEELVGMTIGEILESYHATMASEVRLLEQESDESGGAAGPSLTLSPREVAELMESDLASQIETVAGRSLGATSPSEGPERESHRSGPSTVSATGADDYQPKAWPLQPDWQRDGCKYWGSRRAGRLHGTGRVVFSDGSAIEGEFRDGEHIRGVASYPNGAEESGSFSRGFLVQGVRMMPEGVVCEGVFEEGILIEGVETAPNGTRREGVFRSPDAPRGKRSRHHHGLPWFKGKVEFPEKEVLKGEFHDGLLEGSGSIRACNGMEWRGEFRKGMPVGLGTVLFPDGSKLRHAFCFPRWVGSLTPESSFKDLTAEQLTHIEEEMGEKDPLIPWAILFSLALNEESLQLFERFLPLALLGWARASYPSLMQDARYAVRSLALQWFCQLLNLKDARLGLRVARSLIWGVVEVSSRANQGESLLTAPVEQEHASIHELLRAWVGPAEEEQEVQSKLLDLINLRDEPFATLSATLFGSNCIRWEDLDPSHPADRQLMWRRMIFSKQPVPEATQWAAGLSEKEVSRDIGPHFAPAWFFDQWLYGDVLPLPARELLECQSPLHLLAIARLQGMVCRSVYRSREPEHRLLAETLSGLVNAGWDASGPQEGFALMFFNSLLIQLSLWSQEGKEAQNLFEVGARLAAAALFFCPDQAPMAWSGFMSWKADHRSSFLEALTSQIRAFCQHGHRPRSGAPARDPALFLCTRISRPHRLGEGEAWLGKLRSQALEAVQIDPQLLSDYRRTGVLIPALRFLWVEGFPLEESELELLMSEPGLLEPADLQRVLCRMKKQSWDKLFREQPLERLLPAFTAWAQAGILPQAALERRDVLDRRCLQQPAALDPLRVEGVLPPVLRSLWSKNLALTPQETAACIMNPGRYPGVDWSAVAQRWPAAMWTKLLNQCGPVAVLRFLVEQLQGRPLKQDRAVAEVLVQACLRAPNALQPYRHHQVLAPCLRELWSAGLPMTRAEVFALFDDRDIRRELPLWPACVKRWPESSWAALLLERGLPRILAVLNEREPKEWSHLPLVARRGLTVGKGGVLVSPAKGASAPAREPESPSAAASMPAESSAPNTNIEFRLTRQVLAQIGRLRGLQADAVRLWLSNAAVGWYAQERPTTIEKDGRSWMHAHVVVPGGGVCIIGYWRDRTGSRCTVGWLMERHNYAQLLSNALAQTEQLHDTVAFEEARLTPQAEASGELADVTSPSRASENDQTQQEEKARLFGALRGDRMAYHGSLSEHDLEALHRWRQRAGLAGEDDLPLQDSLEELESWLVSVVEQFYDLVGAPAKPLNRQRGPQGYAIYRFQTIWSRSMHAVSRFFPGVEHEISEWSDMLVQLERISEILACWPKEWWPEGAEASLSSWMKLAARCDASLDLAGVPVEQRPLRLDELTRLAEQTSAKPEVEER